MKWGQIFNLQFHCHPGFRKPGVRRRTGRLFAHLRWIDDPAFVQIIDFDARDIKVDAVIW